MVSAIAIVFPHMAVLRRHFLPHMHFQCCMLLQRHPQWKCGHLCCQRWIYCLGTPLETPFKTNWREGLSCIPIQFFSTAFDPRVDNGYVLERRFWDASPSWLHLKTKEQMRPIIHLRKFYLLWWFWCSLRTLWTSGTSWTSWASRFSWPTTRMASSSFTWVYDCSRSFTRHSWIRPPKIWIRPLWQRSLLPSLGARQRRWETHR